MPVARIRQFQYPYHKIAYTEDIYWICDVISFSHTSSCVPWMKDQCFQWHLSHSLCCPFLCRVLSPDGRKKHQQHTVLILESIGIKCEGNTH